MTSRPLDRRPAVLVVACGGTISSVRSGAGAAPTLDASQLVDAVPQVAEIAEIEARTFSVVPSAHVTLDDVLVLHDELRDWATALDGRAGGIAITQGTDTLEEVAFALDLLWESPVPIVVTGAMRNVSLPGADGAANVLAAVAVASSAEARGMGVLVALNDQVHAARHVRKTHTASTAAFASPTLGPVGYVAEGRARIVLAPRGRQPLGAGFTSVAGHPVALLTTGIGDEGRLLEHVLPAGYRGVVIEAFGGGHLTVELSESEALRALVDAVPVVLASRTGAGAVLRETYSGWVGSEADLLARGMVSAGILDGPKARVLLTFLLAAGADRDAIAGAFARLGLAD